MVNPPEVEIIRKWAIGLEIKLNKCLYHVSNKEIKSMNSEDNNMSTNQENNMDNSEKPNTSDRVADAAALVRQVKLGCNK